MKKAKHILIPMATIVAVFIVLGILLAEVMKMPISNRMFTTIEELAKLELYVVGDAAPISAEPNDAEVEAHYCKVVEFDGEKYSVYAYIFTEERTARNFFFEITGKETNRDWNFSMSSNFLFRTRYIIYNGRNLFMVKGGSQWETTAFINWLNATFSEDFTTVDSENLR